MRDLVKGLGEVQQDSIYMCLIIQSLGKVNNGDDKLHLCGSVLPETMLSVNQDFQLIKLAHNIAVYNVF